MSDTHEVKKKSERQRNAEMTDAFSPDSFLATAESSVQIASQVQYDCEI
jgi:hypothetical protein